MTNKYIIDIIKYMLSRNEIYARAPLHMKD
jgi:hypothetical protein